MVYAIILILILSVLVGVIIWLSLKLRNARRKEQETKDMLLAVSVELVSLHVFDLKNDTFYAIKSNPVIENFTQQLHSNIRFQLYNVMKYMAAEGARDSILEFVNTDTLIERMGDRDIIYCDFEGSFSGWCRAQFFWLDKEKKLVLFGVRMIDDDKAREDNLRYVAERDMMTGLFNNDTGKRLVSNSLQRVDKGMFCLFEIDDFKELNEKLGSIRGDEIIRHTSTSIYSVLGKNAIIYRRGGARFAAFVKDIDDKTEARFVLNKIIERVAAIDVEEYDDNISMSIGVAFYREKNTSIEELIANAESGLSTSRDIVGVSVSYFD